MFHLIKKLTALIIYTIHPLFSYRLRNKILEFRIYMSTQWARYEFSTCGNDCRIGRFRLLRGAKYMSLQNHVSIGCNVVLEAWDKFQNQQFNPFLSIGYGSSVGDDSHISCINRIIIGNHVRMGRKIFITDNAHGASEKKILDTAPNLRPLYSKGPVIIHDNVWIGEMVCILPGVTIGKGSIIGANAVVTKNVPPYSVVGGNPARVLRQLN